jgi:hypothetical protein
MCSSVDRDFQCLPSVALFLLVRNLVFCFCVSRNSSDYLLLTKTGFHASYRRSLLSEFELCTVRQCLYPVEVSCGGRD